MHNKIKQRYKAHGCSFHGVVNILITLLAVIAFITMFTSCRESLPSKEDGSSLQSSANANEIVGQSSATTNENAGDENKPGGSTKNVAVDQDTGQSDSTGQSDLSGQSESIQPSEEKAEPEPLVLDDDLRLGELQVDMPKNTVNGLINAKLSSSKSDNSYGFESETLTYDDGTEIHLVDGRIYSISVVDSDYPTPRGLRVGDSAEKVKKLYGEPAAIEENGLWIYSARGYDLLYVTIKDGIVKAIKVSLVM